VARSARIRGRCAALQGRCADSVRIMCGSVREPLWAWSIAHRVYAEPDSDIVT